MSYGPVTIFSTVLTAGTTITPAVNVTKSYSRIYLDVPSFSSANLMIQGSADGVTYRRILTDALAAYTIASTLSNRICPIPQGIQYYKVEATSALSSDNLTLKFICAD